MTVDSHDLDSPPPEPPLVTADITDSDKEVKEAVPKKYHNYLDVFSPSEVKNSQNTVLTISTLNWKMEKHLLLGPFIRYLRMNAKPYSNTSNITSKKDLFVDPLHLLPLLSFLLNEKLEI